MCAKCGTAFELRDGIYRFLLPERLSELQPFLDQYRAVREKDGYRSPSPNYYRSLPKVERNDPQAETWRIRQTTFKHLCKAILPHFKGRHRLEVEDTLQGADGYAEPNPRSGFPLNSRRRFPTDAASDANEADALTQAPIPPARHRLKVEDTLQGADGYDEPNPRSGFLPNSRRRFPTDAVPDAEALSILDLGAGNGWLSHRLAALGHQCAAVDWLDDAEDGLGASRYYPVEFLRVQADFDQLPFAPGQFDLVIFNAALHYSPNVSATLGRAAHLLAPGGMLAVMDSPTFQTIEAGRRMLTEMEDNFKMRYGVSEVVRSGVGYLIFSELVEIGRKLEMKFQFIPSRGGWLWETRRLLAGLKNGRESARFGLAFYR